MARMIKDPFARLNLDREVLTVSQLNGRARVLLEDVFSNIWVEGEISNLARPASGHIYFTLKDSGAQVRCALFRNNAARVRQALKDGLAVKVRGKVSLFEGRGDYQLILDTVEPAGDGALRLAFDALKKAPAHPRRIRFSEHKTRLCSGNRPGSQQSLQQVTLDPVNQWLEHSIFHYFFSY